MILRSIPSNANSPPIVHISREDDQDNPGTKISPFFNYWERFCEENPSEPECKIYDT